jgi:hypothetical protein
MICISDEACVQRCKDNGFPCYDYQHDNATDPIFLQIGKLKLYYTGEALAAGADVMLLDLDVSFLRDPLELMAGFLDNETEHIRCQMDLVYSMNKDRDGDLYWFSHPGPNFGLFLVKASEITVKVFKEAWTKYQKVPFVKKNRVAVDQNVMNGALSAMQWRMRKQFVSYFFIGTDSDDNKRARVRYELLTPLLDKIENYSPDHIRFELGASAARQELRAAIAVHATCYEGSTKLLALKAVNAFWDTRYTMRCAYVPMCLFAYMRAEATVCKADRDGMGWDRQGRAGHMAFFSFFLLIYRLSILYLFVIFRVISPPPLQVLQPERADPDQAADAGHLRGRPAHGAEGAGLPGAEDQQEPHRPQCAHR